MLLKSYNRCPLHFIKDDQTPNDQNWCLLLKCFGLLFEKGRGHWFLVTLDEMKRAKITCFVAAWTTLSKHQLWSFGVWSSLMKWSGQKLHVCWWDIEKPLAICSVPCFAMFIFLDSSNYRIFSIYFGTCNHETKIIKSGTILEIVVFVHTYWWFFLFFFNHYRLNQLAPQLSLVQQKSPNQLKI